MQLRIDDSHASMNVSIRSVSITAIAIYHTIGTTDCEWHSELGCGQVAVNGLRLSKRSTDSEYKGSKLTGSPPHPLSPQKSNTHQTMVPPRAIPLYVLERILGYLRICDELGDTAGGHTELLRMTQSSCALVSSQWRELVVPIQFETLKFSFVSDSHSSTSSTSHSQEKGLEPKYSKDSEKSFSHLYSHVRTVELRRSNNPDHHAQHTVRVHPDVLVDVLNSFPRLTTLSATQLFLRSNIGASWLSKVLIPPRLERLDSRTNSTHYMTVFDTVGFLCLFREIREVNLVNFMCSADVAKLPHPIRCKVESLHLRNGKGVGAALAALAGTAATSALQVLEIGIIAPNDFPQLKAFFRILPATLTALTLHIDIYAHDSKKFSRYKDYFDLFSEAVFRRVRTLRIIFTLNVEHWNKEDLSGWTTIARLLSFLTVKRCPLLNSVRFDIRFKRKVSEEEYDALLQLPSCDPLLARLRVSWEQLGNPPAAQIRAIEDALMHFPTVYFAPWEGEFSEQHKAYIREWFIRLRTQGTLRFRAGDCNVTILEPSLS